MLFAYPVDQQSIVLRRCFITPDEGGWHQNKLRFADIGDGLLMFYLQQLVVQKIGVVRTHQCNFKECGFPGFDPCFIRFCK